MKVKSESEVAQSRPTLRDPMDCSPPGSPVPGSLQARVLEWVPSTAASALSKKLLGEANVHPTINLSSKVRNLVQGFPVSV